MVVPEVTLLRARDPSITNSDDWPVFPLKRVKIVSHSTGLPVSLFTAHQGHAIRVVGYLDKVGAENAHMIRDPKYETKALEIPDLRSYTFADFDNGTYGFWVTGKAGWFELKDPAVSYRGTFDGMNEAAGMFYFMASKYRNAIAAKWSLHSRTKPYHLTIFKGFLASPKNCLRRSSIDDVRDGFHSHREFLIASMLEGQEGLDWSQNPMLQYYKKQFPDLHESVKARIFPVSLPEPVSATQHHIEPATLQPAFEGSAIKFSKRKIQANQRKTNGAHAQASRLETEIKDSVSMSEDELYCLNPNSHRRKSILQPVGSKRSKKSASQRKTLPYVGTTLDGDGNNIDADDDASSIPDKVSSSNEFSSLVLPSRTRSGPHVNSEPGPFQKVKSTRPHRYLELKLERFELPSTEPQGPGDLWTCAFRGCGKTEHQASTAEGQERINLHFQLHAEQAQELIELAKQESRPYLPVNHLIRRLAPEADPDYKPDLKVRTRPIVRRY